jgi:hypothetical protein
MITLKGRIYIASLWWHTGNFLLATNLPSDQLEDMLNEYRSTNPEEYNDAEFLQFLHNKKGVHAEIIEPDYDLYF